MRREGFLVHFGLVGPLARFFCLPPVPASLLNRLKGSDSYNIGRAGNEFIWLHLKAVPMGWSWAFWLAQRVHKHIALRASRLDY